MIASKTKEQEREIRNNLLRTMKVCVQMYEKTKDDYWKKELLFYGNESKRYKERMQNHDYSEEDAMIARVDELHKKWLELEKSI